MLLDKQETLVTADNVVLETVAQVKLVKADTQEKAEQLASVLVKLVKVARAELAVTLVTAAKVDTQVKAVLLVKVVTAVSAVTAELVEKAAKADQLVSQVMTKIAFITLTTG